MTYTRLSLSIVSICILSILAFRCAGMYSPSGGPLDTTPPSIIETYPLPNTLNFSETHVSITFSEYVNKPTFEQAVFISPNIGKLDFDWSGANVDISFEHSLKDNTTYVITVGTDVSDYRNRNKMKDAFSLAFSTGSQLDSGKISGKVFDGKPAGIMIFAYSSLQCSFDTLSPLHTSPDYISQTGSDGTYSLRNLAMGGYRLFAVRDDERNLLYDPESNEIGITTRDVVLTDSTREEQNVNFRMTKEDVAQPFLLSAEALSLREIRLSFSEPLDTSALSHAVITIADSLNNSVQVKQWYPEVVARKQLYVETARQSTGTTYIVVVSSVYDTAGNTINQQSDSVKYFASEVKDSTATFISSVTLILDSLRNIAIQPEILCAYNTSIHNVSRGFSLSDSVGNNIPIKVHSITPKAVSVSPKEKLQNSSWYSFTMKLDSITDTKEYFGHDSTLIRRFRTVEVKDYGILKGEVVLDNVRNNRGSLFVQAKNIENRTVQLRQIEADAKNQFEFNDLLQGKYQLSVFRDADGNKKYSYGKAFPFVPAEHFTENPDTLKVRARWSVEGVKIKF